MQSTLLGLHLEYYLPFETHICRVNQDGEALGASSHEREMDELWA